jgi:transcriptional regulator with XRE-family HTH domain
VAEAAEPNPTLARRRLAVRFQKLREQNGRGLDDLATFLGVAMPQASRLDTGARGFQQGHVDKLADWYGLAGAERAELLDLQAESRKRGWWQKVSLFDSYRTFIGMEQAAEVINEYGNSVVPGLLQTRDYARAAAAGGVFDATPQQIEDAADLRIRRQRILDREVPPVLSVVIDEAVLARTTGGAGVMRAQLAHLEEMSERPRVAVRVVAFEGGVYLGSTKNHFIVLEMGEGLPDILYLEGVTGPEDTKDKATLREYRRAWDQLRAIALDTYASRALIQQYRSRLPPGRAVGRRPV